MSLFMKCFGVIGFIVLFSSGFSSATQNPNVIKHKKEMEDTKKLKSIVMEVVKPFDAELKIELQKQKGQSKEHIEASINKYWVGKINIRPLRKLDFK